MKQNVVKQAVSTAVELFKGFNIGQNVSKALNAVHTVKEATPVVVKSGKNKGKPVLKKNGEQKMKPSQDYTVVRFLPLEASADKPSIKANTGLTGQALFTFEADAQTEANLAYLAFMVETMKSGQYDFRSARRNNKNGVITSSIRPSKERVIAAMTEEQALKTLGMTKEQYDSIKAKLAKPTEPAQIGG